jgi:small-conductance mechanosensitive channel/CRP-like cAMP-binding protein
MAALSSRTQTLLIDAALVPLIFILLLFVGRWLKRKQGVKLGFDYLLFSLVAAGWIALHALVIDFPHRSTVLMNTTAALIVLSAFVIVALLRRYLWELWFEKHQHSKVPKFLSQVVGLVIVVAALLIALGGIYGVSIHGAVLGSTVVVGIIGFAMQDLLGNIIAGIAIEIGKPFRVGDWLVVDGKFAEVTEVNWRSVRLRDNDDVYFDIPNKSIVGSTVVNLTHPHRTRGSRFEIGFEYEVPPNTVKDVLRRAAQKAPGVLSSPPVKVFLKDFADSAIVYEVRFFLEDQSRFNDITDAIRTNIWYETRRAGLRIPFPIRTVQIERAKADQRGALEIARTSIRRQPFLQLLDPAQLDRLLADARLLRFGRGEHIIEQGEEGRSMFILVRGEADVFVHVHNETKHVATLRDGDYCGEMSLLTGEVRSASVQARTDCEMWEIGKETLADILAENHPLLERLSEILAKRKMEVDGIIEASMAESEKTETVQRYKESFLKRLYGFFEL